MSKSTYDPFKHHRRTVRYADWDYRTPGYYFITICTHGRQNLFDDQNFVIVAKERLLAIPTQPKFRHVKLDQWIIMPNHVHIILWLVTWPEAVLEDVEKREGFTHAQAGSIGSIVATYKGHVTNRINKMRRQQGAEFWQTGYWDRIIRDEDELNRTRQYIIDNPARWAEDRENLDVLLDNMIYHQ